MEWSVEGLGLVFMLLGGGFAKDGLFGVVVWCGVLCVVCTGIREGIVK